METGQQRIVDLLIQSHESGQLPEASRRELNELLRGSEENREFASQFLFDGESITELLSAEEIAGIVGRRRPRKCDASPRFQWKAAGAIAAVILLTIGAAYIWFPVVTSTATPIAVLSDQADAELTGETLWENGHLGAGRYTLRSGIIKLTLRGGPTVTVQGFSEFQIVDESEVVLSRGQMRVFAPIIGQAVTIATPDAHMIAHGAEFGVFVDSVSGDSRVEVFDGLVDVKNVQSKTVLASLELGDTAWIREGRADSNHISVSQSYPTPDTLGLARWEKHDERVRADQDVLLYFAFDPEVSEDVLPNASLRGEVINGIVRGSRWVTGRWPGKQALLFDRPGDCVEFTLPGELPQFTVSLWVNVDRYEFGLTPILNSAGWEEGDFHLQVSQVRNTLFGGVFPSKFQSGSEVDLPTGRWTHIAAVVDTKEGFVTTFIDGKLATKQQLPPNAISRPGFCRLGAWHYTGKGGTRRDREFRGRMDELVVWQRALSDREIWKLAATGQVSPIVISHLSLLD